jgi:ceramide glucosyltransferase
MGRRAFGGLRGRAASDVTIAIIVLASAAGLYQVLALIATLYHKRQPTTSNSQPLPVSILKPVYGKDAGFYEAIRTHALQQFPEFEILFGIRRPDDPAIADVERLMREFPALPIRWVLCTSLAPNLKVGSISRARRAIRF